MRYGIPTRVYNLSSDHLGGLLNLMSDLHDWITKGYIIKINVYLIHYRERLNKILDSDIYKIELINYPVVIPEGPKNPKHFNIDHPPKIKTEVCQSCLGTGNIAIPVFSERCHFPVLYEHEECPICGGSGRRKQ